MRYRRFGQSELVVSEVGFGVWTLASDWWGHVDDKQGLLHAALDAGINFIDTAPVYGDGGLGEELLAEVLATHRDEIVLTTKCGYDIEADRKYPGQSERPHDWDPASIRRQLEGSLKSASKLVKAGPNELPEKIEHLIENAKKLEKELADAKRKLAFGGGGTGSAAGASGGGGLDELAGKARALAFGKAIAAKVDVPDGAMLRELAEKLRDKLGDAVVLLGSVNGPKAQLVCTVSKSLTDKFKAGDLIRPIAQILGGSGGGRPDMAQAGGTDIAKLDEALEKLYALVS